MTRPSEHNGVTLLRELTAPKERWVVFIMPNGEGLRCERATLRAVLRVLPPQAVPRFTRSLYGRKPQIVFRYGTGYLALNLHTCAEADVLLAKRQENPAWLSMKEARMRNLDSVIVLSVASLQPIECAL